MNTKEPSGTLPQIEADALASPSTSDDFFRRGSMAAKRIDLTGATRLRSGEPSVYASFLGSIPPEESDEEFAAAVASLS